MKNSKVVLLSAFAFTSFFSNAQINQTPVHTGNRQVEMWREKSQTVGSQYHSEKFLPAKVSNIPGSVVLRYNAYSDYFEMSDGSAEPKILTRDPGVTITFNGTNKAYTYVDFVSNKEGATNGYLNVIASTPKVKIYKRENIILVPEAEPGNGYQKYKPAEYKKATEKYYISVNDTPAVEFSGRKDLLKLVPEKSKEVQNFIKENKIDLEDNAGLQKLGIYMNSIL